MLDSLKLVQNGLSLGEALRMTIVDKSFDTYEEQLIHDVIKARIPEELTSKEMFG